MGLFNDYIAPILLAILQGVTEFLPVSSSGHLVLLNQMMEVDRGIVFDLILHLATLVSVVLYYWHDIVDICTNGYREIRHQKDNHENLKFVGFLIIATFITGVIGLVFNDMVETTFRSMTVVGILLIANAGILMSSKKRGLFPAAKDGKLGLLSAIILGFVQGLAVLPGISRSGTTITASLIMGIEPEQCAKISFLLSIPVILGAVILHIKDLSGVETEGLVIIGISAVIASIVGYFSLVVLNKILKRANFHYFAPYCLVIGTVAMIAGIIL